MFDIDHIAIYAKNILTMSNFYSTLFGFDRVNTRYHLDGKIKMVSLRINESQLIELFNFDGVEVNNNADFVKSGYMHIGLRLENIDQFLTTIDKSLIEQDFIGMDTLRHIFIRDPENNQIEVSEK